MLETFSNSICCKLNKPRRHYFGFIKLSIVSCFLLCKKVKSAWKLLLNGFPQLLHYIRFTIIYYFHHIANRFVRLLFEEIDSTWHNYTFILLSITGIEKKMRGKKHNNLVFNHESILEELACWRLNTNKIMKKKSVENV